MKLNGTPAWRLNVWGWLFCLLAFSIGAQTENHKWQRVNTGEDFVIDMDISSATFEAGHVLRVKFRTTFLEPLTLKEKPGTKYNRRLETIEFNLKAKLYRFHDISVLDPTGKTVESYEANAAEEWRVLKDGGMMQRLFEATRPLAPFGNWKVVDCRFEDGPCGDARAIERLKRTRVSLNLDSATIGENFCSAPAYQSKQIADKEFIQRLAISLASPGLKADYVDAFEIKCKSRGSTVLQGVLVKLPDGKMLMLWEGFVLVLKKERY